MDDLFSCNEDDGPPAASLQSSSLEDYPSTIGSGGQYLLKVETDGDCPELFLLVNDRPDCYYLEASDGSVAWTGTYSHTNMKKVAEEAKMPDNDVAMETRKALTGEGNVLSEYTYKTVKDPVDESLQFTWKKHLVADDVKLTMGSVVMDACQGEGLHARIMNFAVSEICHLREAVTDLKLEKERLVNERGEALSRLEKCVDLKEEIEGDLYAKFKEILNQKKAKIRRLMESLNANSSHQHGMETRKRKSNDPDHAASKTFTDSTDEEVIDDEDPVNKESISTPSPKTEGTSFIEGSLLKDEWQEEAASPPVKRRKRNKKSTSTGGRGTKANVGVVNLIHHISLA